MVPQVAQSGEEDGDVAAATLQESDTQHITRHIHMYIYIYIYRERERGYPICVSMHENWPMPCGLVLFSRDAAGERHTSYYDISLGPNKSITY